jgi:glycosyltransferase involved in cell wall biosynthesis
MSFSLISCIVPVFNGERYLKEALDSILAQSYRRLEIIVADDGSTDKTAAVVATFGEQVRYFRQSNHGPAAARNCGIRLAAGEFVAFLDADDLWHPQKLQRQLERFQRRPELDYCVTHVENFWVPELQDEAARYRDHRISKPLPGYVTGTLMARRAVFQRIGTFNAALGHGDSADWFLRAEQSGASSELLPDVLMYRRLHNSNRSRVRAAMSREEFLRIVKSRLDRKRAVE